MNVAVSLGISVAVTACGASVYGVMPRLSTVGAVAQVPSEAAGGEEITRRNTNRPAAGPPRATIPGGGKDSVPDSPAGKPSASPAGGTCDSQCDFCHCGTPDENNCLNSWFYDTYCDCGCQWLDPVCDTFAQECGGGGPCGPGCQQCWIDTEFENNCPDTWCNDGECDCGCQWVDYDCGGPSCGGGGQCESWCDWCHIGTSAENNCPPEWCNDGECDCGCQWVDYDCGGPLCDTGGPCEPGCEICWIDTQYENNCFPEWCNDGECDCGCQWVDQDCGGPPCGGGGGEPDLIVQSSSRSPGTGVNPGDLIDLSDTVANVGTGAAETGFYVTWFISQDNNVTVADLEWAYRELSSLGSGATSNGAGQISWPDIAGYNTPEATYYVSIMADDTNTVSESNENNNWGQVWPVTLAAPPGDDYEPDDFPQQATTVNCGDTHAHTIELNGDVDWSRITLQAGQYLTVETLNLSGTNADTVLLLYNSACGLLTLDNDGGQGPASLLEWTATYGGTHYIKATTFGGSPVSCDDRGGGNASCAYDISFSCCPRPPTPANPVPSNGATLVPLDTTLCWTGGGRSPSYDVYFGACGAMQLVTTTTGTCWTPPTLASSAEYCWQVATKDDCGETGGQGPWSFETVFLCRNGQVTWREPPNGVVDARQPRKVDDGGVRQGIDRIVVAAPMNTDPRCWTLCETMAEGTANEIASVADSGFGIYTLTLQRRITPGAVTTITYGSTSRQIGSFTSLPADSNGDGIARLEDIDAMVECCLRGGCPAPTPYRCDIDQSGGIDAADILRLLDLLNGAGEFTRAWNLATVHDLGECD